MGLKRVTWICSPTPELFAPYMGLKRKGENRPIGQKEFAPYMGLKRSDADDKTVTWAFAPYMGLKSKINS